MTAAITALIASYGYLAVFVGTLLEGETILLAAGYAAQRGLLHWPVVIAIAIVGGTLGDQIAFMVGRWKGTFLIARFPGLAHRVPQVHRLLERHHVVLILVIRFLYGLRIVGPIIMGTSQVPFFRFVVLNFVGAILWALIVSGAGYYFGVLLEVWVADVEHMELFILPGILLTGFIAALWLHWRSAHYKDDSNDS
ncbi:MAG: DedA family protein [Burkholderiales bacterium]|nr:DedA family protein [Ferrovum sp.]